MALGAGDDFKVVNEKKIEIIMQTDSSKAVAKKGAESNRLSSVKAPEFEKAHQNERRRYKRFSAPPLASTSRRRRRRCRRNSEPRRAVF